MFCHCPAAGSFGHAAFATGPFHVPSPAAGGCEEHAPFAATASKATSDVLIARMLAAASITRTARSFPGEAR
jgi:hypothetical protein